MNWNSSVYDNKHDFVAEYGKGLLDFIPQNKEQDILDLGCGTGILTAELKRKGNRILGVDSSCNMIDKAKENYNDIDFMVIDALDLPFEKEWDIVFSNAVFHWIKDHDVLLNNIYKALRTNGRLICEFGANGNIATIDNAFSDQCALYGYGYKSKFNFPTVDKFRELLVNHKFVIDEIYDFDRPTPLKDNERGLENWIRQFYASELEFVPDIVQKEIIENVEEITRAELWNGKMWIADYRRLRVVAHT